MRHKKLASYHWHSLSALALTSAFALTSPTALSDDVEVYLQEPPGPVPPNILFVLDESGSMQWGEQDNSQVSYPNRRRDLLVNALIEVFSNDDMSNVNAALLGYSGRGFYAHSGAFKVISEGTNQATFLQQIESLSADAHTPTVSALNAAIDWFTPGVTFTDQNGNSYVSPLEATGVSAEDMWCAPNHIILLSDGQPNSNPFNEYKGTQCSTDNLFQVDGWDHGSSPGDRCATEMAAWANATDLMEGTGWDGVQNITISTMGFYTKGDTRTFLERIAESGGGAYYDSSGGTLVQDLSEIITSARTNVDYVYTAPVIPFNAENAAITGEEIYVPLFLPDSTIFWKGNLKKYSIELTDDGELVLRALGGDRVLNDEQEFQSTRDLFCENDGCEPDEGDPLVGGAAQDMTEVRNLYTYLGSDPVLSNAVNRVTNANTAVTTEMLGVANEGTRTELLNWITRDPAYVETDENPSHSGVMGAAIHTQPVVVTYNNDEVVMIPTSEGVLHAIDADSGEELWAFMPQDLLPGIRTIKNNEASSIPYYGLDGPMTYYEVGNDKMLIFGMRRGGRKYHILNISERLAPEYVAEISSEANPVDFAKLGQTWSKPLFVKMLLDGTEQEVLIFGGGYDPDQDSITPPVTDYSDDEGNVIYIVKASDGSLLKSISNTGADVNISEMTNAIASDLATVDLNGDARVDRLYASDVGGRIIRVDIDETNDTISGGVLADINANAKQHRKFFVPPQVGYFNKSGTQFLTILIGTGDIANPLDSDVTNRFYMIKDPAIWYIPEWDNYQANDDEDFLDASETTVSALTAGSLGWYIDYTGTEKSYSKAILYDYSIFFTTYSAETVAPEDPCNAVGTVGTARLYGLNLLTANAVLNWDGSSEDTLTLDDRSQVLDMQGIPPSPALVFPADSDGDGTTIGKKVYLFSDLVKQTEWVDRFRPIYWEEVINE
ncbi:MAG: PilC/PilY family type IV pilus protein [Candidatus Thiodiazotropha sp.]|jgi:type IV pilus assembly protein PilY1